MSEEKKKRKNKPGQGRPPGIPTAPIRIPILYLQEIDPRYKAPGEEQDKRERKEILENVKEFIYGAIEDKMKNK